MKKMFIIGAIVTSLMAIFAGVCQTIWHEQNYDVYGRRIVNIWNELEIDDILSSDESDVLNSKFEETYDTYMNSENYWNGVYPIVVQFTFTKGDTEYVCFARSFVEDDQVTHFVRCDSDAARNIGTDVFYSKNVNVEF